MPDGRVLLVFVGEGFETREVVVEVRRGHVTRDDHYLVRMSTNPYRTVVTVDPEKPATPTERTFQAEEARKIPGSRGDAIYSVQNFPGFARAPFGIGTLVIRGAAPGDSAVYVLGHEAPRLFHFGGFRSSFNSDLVGAIGYFPSNFDSPFGDATGGLVDVELRAPRTDGHHGYVGIDVLDFSAMAEGPAGKVPAGTGSYAVSLRRSHLDVVLRPLDAVAIAPRYWDYQAQLAYPVGPGELGIRALGSDDQFVALQDLGQDFELHSGFHRAEIWYRMRKGRWSVFASPSFNYTTDETGPSTTTTYTFSTRLEAKFSQSRHFGIVFGTETRAGWSDIQRGSVLEVGAEPGAGPTELETHQPFAIPAVYSTLNFRAGKERPLTVSPSLRFTTYAMPMAKVALDPRLGIAWQVAPRWNLKAGVGLYSQAPTLTETSEEFGNPDLDVEKAMHVTAGVAVALPGAVAIELTGFYKQLWDQAVPALTGGYTSDGFGRSYGGELLIRRDFTAALYGWVAYTLSRTEEKRRWTEPYALSSFDQTHILTVVAGYKLPRNWSVGLRFRLTSGQPTTPQANGFYDATTNEWTPLPADPNSDRLPMFHQLDLRVDKIWTLRKIRLVGYLDIQNVYYAKNTEFIVYSYDSTQSARVTSLPILPSLGFRLEW